ncbi:MAG: nucleotide exchange factor GrpE [Candidatus Pacebacteria bacterium]|nr:nucleotide exchange factor GrpE [Candidatus Paceibacterota bacterium]
MKEKKENSEIEKLKKEIEKLKKEKEQYLAGWQRARADYLNYLKEEKGRLKEFLEVANQKLVVKLLPVLDSFKRAEEVISQDLKGNQVIQGFLQIRNQLREILKAEGLEEIETEVGQEFNSEIHEAIGKIERNDLPQNSVAQVLEKGYKFKGKVVRPVKVKISFKGRKNNQ